MPHVCDTCGKTYPNGSDAMLSGCESCGATTFQYVDSLTEQTGNHTNNDDAQDIIDGDDEYVHPMTADGEDDAQQAARAEIIEPDELDGYDMNDVESIKHTFGSEDDEGQSEDSSNEEADQSIGNEDNHDTVTNPETVRDKLTRQFESIRILAPGEYELNLRGLYEQENRIIRVKEDGRYVIQLQDEDE